LSADQIITATAGWHWLDGIAVPYPLVAYADPRIFRAGKKSKRNNENYNHKQQSYRGQRYGDKFFFHKLAEPQRRNFFASALGMFLVCDSFFIIHKIFLQA
jgi:hypothetical protein